MRSRVLLPSRDGEGAWVECEVVASLTGYHRGAWDTVTVHVPGERGTRRVAVERLELRARVALGMGPASHEDGPCGAQDGGARGEGGREAAGVLGSPGSSEGSR